MHHRNSRRIQRRVRAFDYICTRFRRINKVRMVGFESVRFARYESCKLLNLKKLFLYCI